MAENSKSKNDEYFMRQAIKEAKKAEALDEVPIGAVPVSYTHLDVYKRQVSSNVCR